MADVHLLAALLGGLVLVLSLATGFLKSHGYLPSEEILALLFGIVIGPYGLGVLRLAAWDSPLVVLEEIARLTVAIAVMSVALQLPERYFRDRARSMAILLGPGMVLMWLASALVTDWLFAVPLAVALLVGAVVTPTDPVLASTIVSGPTAEENVPIRLRHLVSGEAGANDGVAYLLVFLAIFLLGDAAASGPLEWVLRTVGWEVGGAVAIGLLVGSGVGWLERRLSARGYLDDISVFTLTIALTFAVLGLLGVLGANDVLGVFVAGLAYNWQSDPRDEAQEGKVEEVFNRAFTLPSFVLFGAAIPWVEWGALGWRAPAFVAGILLLRRLPMVLALRPWIRPLDRRAATLFVGWFGPVGIAAVLYATLAVREAGTELPWILGSLAVTGSILVHGATSTVLTHRYGRLGDDAEWW